MKTRALEIHEGSENIFADLGLPDAESHFLKAKIVAELYRLTNSLGLTQSKAGALMGISQPEVSRLFKGHFREYSIDRLMNFLTRFNQDVEIVVRPRLVDSGRGEIRFSLDRV
jgi:predicted XRE-type DNA-binding protein